MAQKRITEPVQSKLFTLDVLSSAPTHPPPLLGISGSNAPLVFSPFPLQQKSIRYRPLSLHVVAVRLKHMPTLFYLESFVETYKQVCEFIHS